MNPAPNGQPARHPINQPPLRPPPGSAPFSNPAAAPSQPPRPFLPPPGSANPNFAQLAGLANPNGPNNAIPGPSMQRPASSGMSGGGGGRPQGGGRPSFSGGQGLRPPGMGPSQPQGPKKTSVSDKPRSKWEGAVRGLIQSSVQAALLQDQHATLWPDVSAFKDQGEMIERLMPYHIWQVPEDAKTEERLEELAKAKGKGKGRAREWDFEELVEETEEEERARLKEAIAFAKRKRALEKRFATVRQLEGKHASPLPQAVWLARESTNDGITSKSALKKRTVEVQTQINQLARQAQERSNLPSSSSASVLASSSNPPNPSSHPHNPLIPNPYAGSYPNQLNPSSSSANSSYNPNLNPLPPPPSDSNVSWTSVSILLTAIAPLIKLKVLPSGNGPQCDEVRRIGAKDFVRTGSRISFRVVMNRMNPAQLQGLIAAMRTTA